MRKFLGEWFVLTLYTSAGLGWILAAIQVIVDMAVALGDDRFGDLLILALLFPFATMIPMLANTVILIPMLALPCFVWAAWMRKDE